MTKKQDYDTYYKEYFAGKGRAARRRAENKWRAKKRLEETKVAEKSPKLVIDKSKGANNV